MPLIIDFKRRVEKRTTTPGLVPTVAPSTDHSDGSWSIADIYPGELYLNLPDKKLYSSDGTVVFEIGSGVGGGAGAQTSWLHRVSSIVVTLPGSPSTGLRVLLDPSAATHENEIAEFNGTSWVYYVPSTADCVIVQTDPTKIGNWNGTAWTFYKLNPTLADILVFGNQTGTTDLFITDGTKIRLYKGANYVDFLPTTLTANRTINLPDKSGVLALLTDIPPVSTWRNTVDSQTNTPPGSIAGRYLVGTSPTGAWVGQANNIADGSTGSWVFEATANGNALYILDQASKIWLKESGVWNSFQTGIPTLFQVAAAGNVAGTFLISKGFVIPEHILTYNTGGTKVIDFSTFGGYKTINLQANVTLDWSGGFGGYPIYLIFKQDATGGRTVAWTSNRWLSASGKPLRVSSTPNSRTYFSGFFDQNASKFVIEPVTSLVDPASTVNLVTHNTVSTLTLDLNHRHNRVTLLADVTLDWNVLYESEDFVIELTNSSGIPLTVTFATNRWYNDTVFGGTIANNETWVIQGRLINSRFMILNRTSNQNTSGYVLGPAGAIDGNIALFDGTTGKIVKDGGQSVASLLARANHTGTQAISTVTGLQAALDALTTAISHGLNSPDTFTPAGSYPTLYRGNPVAEGDTFQMLSAGTMGAKTVNSGDLLICMVDSPGQTDANWAVQESNLDQMTESVKGVAKVATQAIIEDFATTNDTDAVTPKKFWMGIAEWVAEVSSTLYSSVRNTLLTGLNLADSTPISATDSVITALGRLQAQITAGGGLYLAKSQDLSDLSSIPTALVNLGLEGLITVADNDYALQPDERYVAQSAVLTAARAWTLPLANSVNDGHEMILFDLSGSLTDSNRIIVTRQGSDTVNGATTYPLATAYGSVRVISDGISKWTAERVLRPQDIGATVQAYHASLNSLVGLTSAADKIGYFSASNTWAITDFTAVGRSFAGLATPGAARFVRINSDGTVSERTAAEMLTDLGLSSATSVTKMVAQASHGFAVGDWLKHSGGSYAKAQANSAANAEVVGVVSTVTDANNFVITLYGYVTGLSSLTADTVYFLSPSAAGFLTATEPVTSGQVRKVLLISDSTTSGFVVNFQGTLLSDANLLVQRIDSSSTQQGNGAGAETDLFSKSVLGNTLSVDGQTLEFDIAGTFAATASTDKRIRVKWGATTIFDSGNLNIIAANDWAIEGVVMRTGAATQKCIVKISTSSATLVSTADYATAAETLSSPVTLKVTGAGTNANDVVGEVWKVKFLP